MVFYPHGLIYQPALTINSTVTACHPVVTRWNASVEPLVDVMTCSQWKRESDSVSFHFTASGSFQNFKRILSLSFWENTWSTLVNVIIACAVIKPWYPIVPWHRFKLPVRPCSVSSYLWRQNHLWSLTPASLDLWQGVTGALPVPVEALMWHAGLGIYAVLSHLFVELMLKQVLLS